MESVVKFSTGTKFWGRTPVVDRGCGPTITREHALKIEVPFLILRKLHREYAKRKIIPCFRCNIYVLVMLPNFWRLPQSTFFDKSYLIHSPNGDIKNEHGRKGIVKIPDPPLRQCRQIYFEPNFRIF